MRIAQVMAGAANGGAELFYERMTLALARAGHEVLPVIRDAPARTKLLRAAGLAPEFARFGGPLDIFTKPALRRNFAKFRPDVVVAWMSRAASFLPPGRRNVGRLGGYYDLKYFRACEYLVGNTRGIVDYICSTGFPAARTRYLPNFVDDFGGVEPADRAALGVPEDARLMLGLGRLHRVKGFDTLIRAVALMPRDVFCVIAGEGPERAALARLIEDLALEERVKLLGWRNDSGALLKTADLFVSASRHEPLGNMVLEAFSAQTPVLAARAAGPLEVIRHGEDGMLVAIDDVASMAEDAKLLLNDVRLRVRLALRARQRFAEEFAQRTVVDIWNNFLTEVAG